MKDTLQVLITGNSLAYQVMPNRVGFGRCHFYSIVSGIQLNWIWCLLSTVYMLRA